jgi:hypothetical protein
MEQINQFNTECRENKSTAFFDSVIIEPSKLNNSLLERLIEEVKNDNANNIFAYDRSHNRHNRGR